MRILFVTPFVPSRQRPSPFNHIKLLSKNHRIVLVALFQTAHEAKILESLKPYCESIHPVHLGAHEAYLNCCRFLMSTVPLFAGYFHSTALRRKVEELASSNGFDLLHAQHIRAAGLVTHVNDLPKVFDSQDCMTMLMKRHWKRRPNFVKGLLYLTEWLKMQRYEAEVCRAFDKITVCSPVDQQFLREMNAALDIDLLFNGADLEYFAPSGEQSEACSLVFVGRLSYYPNRDALLYLYRDVLPLIRKRFPAVKLCVVGGGLPSNIEKVLKADPNVEMAGHVDDVRPFLRRATVSTAPMRLGAGTNFKIVEALAMGVPVVTTSQGCEGLAVVAGHDLVCADTRTAFAERVCELLDDASKRREFAAAGRRYVETYHSWEVIVSHLESIYAEVTS